MAESVFGLFEFEGFDDITGFAGVKASWASGGQYLQANTTGVASASALLSGYSGVFDIKVTYYDENDGVSSSAIKIDGTTIAAWTWDAELGSPYAGPQTLATYTISNVSIGPNSLLTFEGRAQGAESLRIDRIELIPAADRNKGAPEIASFEGAEGFGATTAGGRGGWIVKVTTLEDSGVGSLRWALEGLSGPRIVVFDVGGVINLKSEIKVNGDVTVAGQTAPGDGITISGARLKVVGDDVIIRGLHIRPGDGAGMAPSDRDAISVGAIDKIVSRVVIDSNSLTWAIDEGASTWYGARDVTYSNNIIAEGLNKSIHDQGAHSMGALIGDGSHRITLINNLFASNNHRNPQIGMATNVEVINNLVFNYGNNGLEVNVGGSAYATMHAIGNSFVAGPNSSPNNPIRLLGATPGSAFYLEDNLGWSRTSSAQPEIAIAEGVGLSKVSAAKIFTGSNATAMSASEVQAYVLAHVGARAQGLDPVDARIIAGVLSGTGKIIDSPSQVPAFTPRSVRTQLVDTDGDGVPDVYEKLLGFDAFRFDAHGDNDKDGYTNIEEYINGLITGFDIDVSAFDRPSDLFIEAEAITRFSGFKWVANGAASNGRVIEARGDGVAGMTWQGERGVYDLAVNYFDENDGVSRIAVYADGRLLDQWAWDQELGSPYASSKTKVSHVISGVQLQEGTELRFVGWGDENEPMRIDTLQFTGVSAARLALPVTVEAEAMTVLAGFSATANTAASGGRWLQAKGEAAAAMVFDGGPGRYAISVNYFDENDGVSRAALVVDGRVVDAWIWDEQLGSPWAVAETRATRTVTDVRLYEGSVVEIIGTGDRDEPFRVDSITFTPDALL